MLNNIGPVGLIIILVVVLLLFGRGKISELMGDVAKGIRSFRDGLSGEDDEDAGPNEIEGESAREGETNRDETRTS